MTSDTRIQLASIRVITADLPRSVRFYQAVTGVRPRWLTADFVEFSTSSGTVALSDPGRVAFITEDTPRAAANESAIIEFVVDDTDALFADLQDQLGDELVVVQEPLLMPWGNQSALIRDPEGTLINLYTPVTEQGKQLEAARSPRS